ncbi:MAG TPA: signal peptidase I [Trichocoleus sp.]
MTANAFKQSANRSLGRSPWLAVNLSVVLPGLGQIYGGARAKGGIIAIAFLLLLLFSAWSIFGAKGDTLTGLLLLLPIAGLYFGGLVDAYRSLSPVSPRPAGGRAEPQDAWYAVFLSQILPGLGHLYCQQSVIGGLLLVAGVGIGYLANFNPALLSLPPLIWALACVHLYRSITTRRNRQSGWLLIIVLGLLIGRLLTGAIPLLVDYYLEQCIVPSGSMLPTLQVDDRLFVRKASDYRPRSQDIVVFRAPPAAVNALEIESDALLVKRVIGLPGQSLEVQNGQLLVNGQPLLEPYLNTPPDYQWGPQTVPPQTLFVLGDNRNNSGDSHIWGFLPEQDLLGQAYKIYWPPGRIRPLP